MSHGALPRRSWDNKRHLNHVSAQRRLDSQQGIDLFLHCLAGRGSVSLITHIAIQAKFLVHSAAVEAARAGHAGKGFAISASEIKNLANQTAKATEEISGKIAEM